MHSESTTTSVMAQFWHLTNESMKSKTVYAGQRLLCERSVQHGLGTWKLVQWYMVHVVNEAHAIRLHRHTLTHIRWDCRHSTESGGRNHTTHTLCRPNKVGTMLFALTFYLFAFPMNRKTHARAMYCAASYTSPADSVIDFCIHFQILHTTHTIRIYCDPTGPISRIWSDLVFHYCLSERRGHPFFDCIRLFLFSRFHSAQRRNETKTSIETSADFGEDKKTHSRRFRRDLVSGEQQRQQRHENVEISKFSVF